jgi:hypothetical protein
MDNATRTEYKGFVYEGFVVNGAYVEMGPVQPCDCTNDQLERGRCCGEDDCPNLPANLAAFEERRRAALEAAGA